MIVGTRKRPPRASSAVPARKLEGGIAALLGGRFRVASDSPVYPQGSSSEGPDERLVFAAAAAVGAGLAVCVDHSTHHAKISDVAAGAAVAVPVAVYLVCLWFLHAGSERSVATRVVAPLVVIGVLLTPFTGQAVLGTGLLMAGLTAFKVMHAARLLPVPERVA